MNLIPPPPFITSDDLLNMPDGDFYELVDGKLVETHRGTQSSYIGGRFLRLLAASLAPPAAEWTALTFDDHDFLASIKSGTG